MLRARWNLLSLCAVPWLALAPMSAAALSITAADLPHYALHADVAGTSVDGSAEIVHKWVGGYDVVGIAGGWEGGEIDASAPESLSFHFLSEPQIVTELSLGALFAQLEEDDLYDEQALVRVTFADATTADFVLAVTSGATATWTGAGSVTNVSPGTFGAGGVWSVSDPFGAALVQGITLLPIGPDTPLNSRNNDYGFVSLSGRAPQPVPEPGTVTLMGAGLAGLALSGRKRKKA